MKARSIPTFLQVGNLVINLALIKEEERAALLAWRGCQAKLKYPRRLIFEGGDNAADPEGSDINLAYFMDQEVTNDGSP